MSPLRHSVSIAAIVTALFTQSAVRADNPLALNPQSEPPSRGTVYNRHFGRNPRVGQTSNPVALNPQPEPPSRNFQLGINPQTRRTVNPVALNPQPEPPSRGLIHNHRFVRTPSVGRTGNPVALNPQPEPPSRGYWNHAGQQYRPTRNPVALNPQPEPPGRRNRGIGYVGLNPQPEPPSRVLSPTQWRSLSGMRSNAPVISQHNASGTVRLTPNRQQFKNSQEEVRNRRQMANTAFQNSEQKSNQVINQMRQMNKALNESRMSTLRNLR